MRDVAVLAIVAFVVWCAALALVGEPKMDAELAAARYRVAEPIASTVTASASGGVVRATSVQTVIPLAVSDPVTVDAHPDRGVMLQVTATDPPVVVVPHYDIWLRLARCESGGDWQIDTGNGYYGGLQFGLTSWRGVDGDQYAPYPNQATPLEQMLSAERLLDVQGWGAWPACSRRLGLR